MNRITFFSKFITTNSSIFLSAFTMFPGGGAPLDRSERGGADDLGGVALPLIDAKAAAASPEGGLIKMKMEIELKINN